jgi:wyosine [tRNA(Phe)-imidazoG37] synthetase (radical SAM superfamily)
LGIDLVPLKTCTYDCIYCQLGRTTHKTCQRKEWVPLKAILEELKPRLSARPDYLTLSGSGEPTLHSGIGSLIKAIKAVTDIPVAVLTNGSLLWLPEVREALFHADLVVPSLDAGSERLFRRVNRPRREISFTKMIQGLLEFRKGFSGHYWLEVLLVGGITGLPGPVEDLAEIVFGIAPERVWLNTVVRPPAEPFATPVPRDLLDGFAAAFGDRAEVIGESRSFPADAHPQAALEQVIELLRRRPCTLRDVAVGLGLTQERTATHMKRLTGQGLVSTENLGGQLFYKATSS